MSDTSKWDVVFRPVKFRKDDVRVVDFGTHLLQGAEFHNGDGYWGTYVRWGGDWWYLATKIRAPAEIERYIQLNFEQELGRLILDEDVQRPVARPGAGQHRS